MSGILRNTLRLVSTAKYAPSQSMTLTSNCLNNSLASLQPKYLNYNEFGKLQFTQAKTISTKFGMMIHDAKEKILSILTDEQVKAKLYYLDVSLGSSKIKLISSGTYKNLIFPPMISIKLNKQAVKYERYEIFEGKKKPLSFNLGKWNGSLDVDESILEVEGTDKIFIIKHAVSVIAHVGLTEPPTNGLYGFIPMLPISNVKTGSAKIVSNSDKTILERELLPVITNAPSKRFDSYGLDGAELPLEKEHEIADQPNAHGRMKLKFPMIASFKAPEQRILMKNSDDYYSVFYTVDIQACNKELPKYLRNNAKKIKKRSSEAGILFIELESGKIVLRPLSSIDQHVTIRHEVNIEIDLDSEVPSICFSPYTKTRRSL